MSCWLIFVIKKYNRGIIGKTRIYRNSFKKFSFLYVKQNILAKKLGIKYSILLAKISPKNKNTPFFLLYKRQYKVAYIPKIDHSVEYEYGITKEKVESENMLISAKKMLNIRDTFFEKNTFKIK